MSLEDKIYHKLQKHLDNQPVGFPPTSSGSDISLLKFFFQSEEVKIALKLSYKEQNIEEIFEQLKEEQFTKVNLQNILENMVNKGIIWWKLRDGKMFYKLLPLMIGLDESVNYNRTPEYIKLGMDYMFESQFPLILAKSKNPQIRTIPVDHSIEPEHLVGNYDDFKKIIENLEGPIVLLDCVCKKTAKINNRPCQKTDRLDTCLVFNDTAERWIKRGLGKQITKEEALQNLKKYQEDGLVLQPSNSKEPEFLCACCGCCCGIISMQKVIPNPTQFWTNNYYATVNAELCEGCRTCANRCQVNAIKVRNKIAKINLKRCIGCGNCVVTCPNQAISLTKKQDEINIPKNNEELYETIMREK